MVPKGLRCWKDRQGLGRRRPGVTLLAATLAAACAVELPSVQTVTFPSGDGLEVTADLYRGIGPEAPTVLLFHQSQSSRGEFARIAPRLQALGYNALAVDLRWGGAHAGVTNHTAARNGTPDVIPRIESGEERPWPIIDASYDDMVASLRWLDSEGYTGARFALGSSFSAMLVYRLGAEEALGGVLAFSPAEYDEERPSLVRSWAHALHAPALSFAALGEEEMVAEVAEEVSVEGSLEAVGSLEGHGASVLDEDPRAWDLLTSFIGQHAGGPPGRSTHRLVSGNGVPLFVDRYPSRGGAVIALFHQGGGSARGEYGFLVSRLVEAGYDVVAADLQGGGDRFGFSNRTLSETPEGADFSYCDAASQLTTVLDSVVSWYPEARRIAWGSSYSGALVLHAAAEGADVERVLAFSPASGGPMGECSANLVADRVEVPTLVVRPAGEAGIGSVREQLALFGAAGQQVVVASPGVHGSSTLNPVRVGADVDATWAVVESFLQSRESQVVSGEVEEPIWTDGDFQDWDAVAPVAIDARGDVSPGTAADLRSVRARVDERFVHLLVDVGQSVTLQGFRGSFEIVIDADGDPETGATEESHLGAEAALVYSQPGDLASGVGFGVGIRRAEGDGLGSLEPAGRAGVLAAPTHSSDRFEIRIERGMPLGGGVSLEADAGFAAITLRLLGPEGPLDELGPFAIPLVPHAVETDLLGLDGLDRSPGQLRVVAWNVSSGQFQRRTAAFQRVLAAVSADVVLLDEVPADVTDDWLDAFFSGVEEAEWEWWLAEGGGVQRTLVASATHAVQGVPSLAKIDYPPGTLEGWVSETDSAQFALSRAALEAEGGLSATGAWIDVEGTPVLFVPLDFQSAGYDGSPQDRLRELQAGVLRDAVADVLGTRPGAGLVFGGDLNLVGSARPLEALVAGLGPAGEDLTVARPLNPLDRSLVTWRSLGNADAFSPGRLDFVALRPGPLEVARAFVFDAGHYAPQVLESLGLLGSETGETSDHLPVVVDFRTGR